MSTPHSMRLHVARLLTIALAGALPWAAKAQSLAVPLKFTYKGGVTARAYAAALSCTAAYTVPAGVSFRLTDFILSNYSSTTTALPYQSLCQGTSSGCSTYLTAYFTAPAGSSMVVNYTSGQTLAAGTTLYACNDNGADYSAWSFTGFLYTNP